jgi:hypothetical protein
VTWGRAAVGKRGEERTKRDVSRVVFTTYFGVQDGFRSNPNDWESTARTHLVQAGPLDALDEYLR